MRAFFLKLLAHEAWANQELLTALRALPGVPPRTQALCAHVMATHRFWELRLGGQDVQQHDFWPALTLNDCAAINAGYGDAWPRYLRSLPDPLAEQRVTYTGLDGRTRYTFRVVDVLTQMLEHSVHHRAQITADLRAAGFEPVNTDYIRYCRQTDNPAGTK